MFPSFDSRSKVNQLLCVLDGWYSLQRVVQELRCLLWKIHENHIFKSIKLIKWWLTVLYLLKTKKVDFPWFSIAMVWLDSHIWRWGRRYGWYSHRDDAGETTGGKPWIWVGEKWEPVGTTDDLVILSLFFVLTIQFFFGYPILSHSHLNLSVEIDIQDAI